MNEWRFEVIIRTERVDDAIQVMLDAFDEHPLDGTRFFLAGKKHGFEYDVVWHDPYEIGDIDYGN